MKQIIFSLLIFISINVFGQAPVKWSFSYNAEIQTVELTAILDDGWHIYSQSTNPNAGPIATSFQFNTSSSVSIKGKTKEPKAIKVYDENFESDLKIFEHQVSFSQKLRTKGKTSLSGTVTYMVCNATICMPPVDEFFEITITN